MTPFEARFADYLRKKAQLIIDAKVADMAAGHIPDMGAYRSEVGYIQALRDMSEWITQYGSDEKNSGG